MFTDNHSFGVKSKIRLVEGRKKLRKMCLYLFGKDRYFIFRRIYQAVSFESRHVLKIDNKRALVKIVPENACSLLK